jgi:hypothetical protein
MQPILRIAALILLCIAPPARAEKVALVIGNATYTHTEPLPNAANDAADMTARLEDLGFTVFGGTDLTRADTLAVVDEFSKALQPEDLALFFYAGHGAQIGTENYIIPVDTQAQDEVGLTEASVRLQTILRTMELRADRRIVILDACRNNPFVEQLASRSEGDTPRGLARVEAGVGSYIAFSTQPGNVALDGTGRNSPFTTALLSHIGEPGEDIHAMMRKVRADVVASTGETQVPWENSSLVNAVVLAGVEEAAAEPVPVAPSDPAPQSTSEPTTPTAPDDAQYHYVGGLDPNGDGFLALRAGTTANSPRLAKMPEGTLLQVLAAEGVWRLDRLVDGREGWAHSRWILCCAPADTRPLTVPTPQSCDELWYQRNAIWAAYGYCFTSDRGIAAFGTAGCTRTQSQVQAVMSPADRAEVERLLAVETAQGCH